MSGKPATPPASRVAVPGAPRLLVYVADPRQLEVGGPAPQQPPEPTSLGAADAVAAARFSVDTALHLPFSSENNVFRTHYEQNPHRNNHDTNQVYFKNFQETDGKPEQAYVASENTDQGVEYFSNSQSYPKVQTLRIDDSKIVSDDSLNNSIKKDISLVNTECPNIDVCHTRVRSETNDQALYEIQCSQIGPVHSVSNSVQAVVSKHVHTHKNFSNENGVLYQGLESGKKDICSGKSVGSVNYQFLEQSVSHQSIVNQSINILNQQVGVGRGLSGPSVAPQLVRTVDGVVLAVVPPTLSAPSASSASISEACLPPVLTQSDASQNIPDPSHTITVPLGWRRIVSGASVLYISDRCVSVRRESCVKSILRTAQVDKPVEQLRARSPPHRHLHDFEFFDTRHFSKLS